MLEDTSGENCKARLFLMFLLRLIRHLFRRFLELPEGIEVVVSN